MAKEITLTADKRTASGSSAVRTLRKQGLLPAVVYGEKGARSIQLNSHGFETLLKHHRSENLIIDLSVAGEAAVKVLLKEVQHGPVFEELLHADFVEISMTKKMRVMIPVRCAGEPVGVSQEGGILEHVLREIEVECLPGDLVESFALDVSALKIGSTLMVRDLVVDPKFTVLSAGDMAIATVVAPRAEEVVAEAAAPVEGAAAGTEPEVIGKKKEEGEEEAEGKEGAGEKKPGDKGEKKPAEKKAEEKKEPKREEKRK
jgi:large subunit ribosomal protein L25